MQDEIEALIQENVGDLPNFRMGGTTTDFEADGAALGVAAETSPDVPDVIRSFIVYFQKNMREGNVHEVHSIYETSFNKLTDRFYKSSPWPPAEAIAPPRRQRPAVPPVLQGAVLPARLCEAPADARAALRVLGELLRHLQPAARGRRAARAGSAQPVAVGPDRRVHLPVPDVLPIPRARQVEDRRRAQGAPGLAAVVGGPEGRLLPARPRREGRDQRDALRCESLPRLPTARPAEAPRAPSARGAMRLSPSSRRPAACRARAGEPTSTKFAGSSLYKMVGYFSLVGLLRVHCLLADYRLALQSVSSIDLGKKGLFTRVTACHISIFYYVGFAYLMVIAGRPTRGVLTHAPPRNTNRPCSQMRRYSDAVRTFSNILFYIARTKQYHTRSYQYDQIVKKNEQANTAAPTSPLPPPSPPSHPSLSPLIPPPLHHPPTLPPHSRPLSARLDPPCRPPLRADVRCSRSASHSARSSPSTST